jgi:hypothetical protein
VSSFFIYSDKCKKLICGVVGHVEEERGFLQVAREENEGNQIMRYCIKEEAGVF